jgi:hypothetical protein
VDSVDVTGKDFQLLIEGGQVKGTLTPADSSQGIRDAIVSLYDEAGYYVDGSGTGSNGDYAVYGVPVGTYVLDGRGPQGSFHAPTTYHTPTALVGDVWHADNLANATRIQVYLCATRIVNLRLFAGGLICGTVTDTTGWPLSNVSVNAYETSCRGRPQGAQTDAYGSYCLGPVWPDDYYLDVHGDADHCTYTTVSYNNHTGSVDRYCNHGRLGELQTVRVTANERTADIDFQMSEAGGGFSGKVTETDGTTPVVNGVVELFDDAGRWMEARPTSADGSYSFCGLAAGCYVARARDPDGKCLMPSELLAAARREHQREGDGI